MNLTDEELLEIVRLKDVWRNMLARCENPRNTGYKDYGGRGIYVCEEWHDMNTFIRWSIDNGSTKGLQIDRTNNDGPYHPDNCRYVTPAVNNKNRRPGRRKSEKVISAFGETKNLNEWLGDPRCILTDIKTLDRRVNTFGWIPEEAITLKSRKTRTRYCPQGHLLTEETTYQRSNGYRMCAECAKDQQKKNYYKEK